MAIKVVSGSETFKVKCPVCGTVFEYESTDLGFRPWFPNGFVYCPTCKKPVRHTCEKYQVKD